MSISQAIVLAAGLGKRMRPITDRIPKPMVEVAGRSLINRALDQLEAFGINKVAVNTSYKAEMLEAHLAERPSPVLAISRETEPLETGGGIFKALSLLEAGPFISMNSDTICVDGDEPALARLVAAWNPDEMDVLMLLHPTDKAIGYPGAGDFVRAEGGRIRRRGADVRAPHVFTGIQVLHPRIFQNCPAEPFSMNVLYDRMIGADGYFNRIATVVHDGDWLHVGDPEGLEWADDFFAKRFAG